MYVLYSQRERPEDEDKLWHERVRIRHDGQLGDGRLQLPDEAVRQRFLSLVLLRLMHRWHHRCKGQTDKTRQEKQHKTRRDETR